jgi:hypothetical protein
MQAISVAQTHTGTKGKRSCKHWSNSRQLQALVKFQARKKAGLPFFCLTGSCAEFHWKPLIKPLQEFLREIGDHSDIENNLVVRRRVVKQYSNVVCTFFHLKTEAFVEDVLKPVHGVSEHHIWFEYAAQHGQIHFCMLAWRAGRLPYGYCKNRF